jgi:hypothetical protein
LTFKQSRLGGEENMPIRLGPAEVLGLTGFALSVAMVLAVLLM